MENKKDSIAILFAFKMNKKLFKDILTDTVGCLLIAVGIYSFAEKLNIAPGGVSGIAIMVKFLSGFPVGLISLFINVPLLIVAYKFIGKSFALRTLSTVVIYTLLIDNVVTPFFPQFAGDRMLGAIFCGICTGGGLGIIFQRGSSTGGTDIVGYLVEKKYPHIPIGKALMFVDTVIIVVSIFVFKNVESALFAVVTLFAQSSVINHLVYGAEKGRNLFIISRCSEKIAQRILKERDRGVTFINGSGAYSRKPTQILMCVVRVWEYHHIKEIVYSEDPHAFVIATEAEHIIGEGFSKNA